MRILKPPSPLAADGTMPNSNNTHHYDPIRVQKRIASGGRRHLTYVEPPNPNNNLIAESSWKKQQQQQQKQLFHPDELKLWDESNDGEASESTGIRSVKPRRKRQSKQRQRSKTHKSKRRSDKKPARPKTPGIALLQPWTPERSSSNKSYGTPETVLEEEEEEEDWFGESEYYASVEVIQKLRNKEVLEITLYVDDYDNTTFQLLIENLLENTVLTAVKVYRLQENCNRRVRSTPEMARLFSALRALRNLEKLELCNMEKSELEMITSIIKRHPTLQNFRLHFTHGGIDDDLLKALVDAPLVSKISLEVHKSFPFSILLESKTLTHLSVQSDLFRFQDDHFVAAMQILEHNDTLTTLDLKPRLSTLCMRALSFAVDENKGLTTLKFNFRAPKERAGKMLLHLAHALTRNSTLQMIKNYSSHAVLVSPADEMRMMELLESNGTIEQLEIFDDDDCVSFKERLLRDNKDRKAAGKGFLAEWLAPCGAIFQCGEGDCGDDFEEVD